MASIVLFLGFANKKSVRDFILPAQEASVSSVSGAQALPGEQSVSTTLPQFPLEESERLPASVNLNVPFTPQAPHANWDLPYKETCEEASLLMVARYKRGEPIVSREDADKEILELVEFENNYFGYYEDTTAEETAKIARKYYGFESTEVVYDFTIEDIKKELAQGNPVLVPAAGRQLGNPYFRRPGPLYHMLVIRGYTKDKFITNDPGTRRGEKFVYDYDVLMNAVHDWNGGEVESGRRVMIVVR